MKFDINEVVCNSLTKWDEVSPTETDASSAITDYYNTGKGWSTRWTSNSHNDHAQTPVSMIGTLQPVTAYGIKVVPFGTFDLMTRQGAADYGSYVTEAKSNTCSALSIKNCDINTWLCGIHVSAELGTSANAYITKGITITRNKIESLCNGVTIYTGHSNSAGIHDFAFKNNKIDIGRSGSLMRFVGVRKLQGLTGNSRSGAVVNCTTADEYVEGPACPQFQHAFRWWCDTKGTYLRPTESEARTVYNEGVVIANNDFTHHGPSNSRYRSQDSDLHFLGTSSTAGKTKIAWTDTTKLETNRELLSLNLGIYIIWGRHVGGEMWNQGTSEGSNPAPTGNAARICNTNGLIIRGNTFTNQKYGSAYVNAGILCQYSPFVKGMTLTNDPWDASYNNESAGMFSGSISHSIIMHNMAKFKITDTAQNNNAATPSAVGHFPSNEPILMVAEGNDNMVGSFLLGESNRTAQDHPYFYQRMGWAAHNTADSGVYLAQKNEFSGNWCGENIHIMSEHRVSYHGHPSYYHAYTSGQIPVS